MNIYLRTIFSVPVLLVFIVMWIAGSVVGGIGSGLVALSAMAHRQTERLLDWINPKRRANQHQPVRHWIEAQPQHANCPCVVVPISRRIGLSDLDEVDQLAFAEALNELEEGGRE